MSITFCKLPDVAPLFQSSFLEPEEGVLAVHDFNLEIKDNEFIVLVLSLIHI